MRDINIKIVAWCFPLVFFASLISWRFLDTWIALSVMERIKTFALLQHGTSDIPDILFLLAVTASGFFWSRYLLLRRQGIRNNQVLFCENAGTSIPLAYFLKWLFKIVFGRTNTRVWLANQTDGGFHWFQGGGDYSSFPSGHMAVFTAFFTTVYLYYPRYRSISIGLVLILAVSLIVTDYHFLSDVLAGGFLGLIVAVMTRYFFEKKIIATKREL